MKKCPFCAEDIQNEAIKCRFCSGDIIKKENIIVEEKVLYVGKAHWSNYIIPVLLIFPFYFFFLFGIYYIYYHKNKKIILTNRKFTYSYGILNKKLLDIKIEKIESIAIRKNLFDIIFGSGTVIITGSGGSNEPIFGIDKPEELKKAIENELNNN